MSANESAFELKECELQFSDLCEKLRVHPFESPWHKCFSIPNERKHFAYEVTEITIDDAEGAKFQTICKNLASSPVENCSNSKVENIDDKKQDNIIQSMEIDESKIDRVKKLLMNEDADSTELAKDLDLLLAIPLQQVLDFCSQIKASVLNETAAALLLNAILFLERQISLTTASAIVQNFIYPKISGVEKTNSRILSTSVSSFTEVYPKTMIDEVMIPCLRKEALDAFESEMLLKMAKTNLPDEYIGYCIKAILEQLFEYENTFSILQNLIERKVQHDQSLHDLLSKKIQELSSVCCNNMKFTKLLTIILSTYGSVLTKDQILLYDEAIRNNRTLVKKAAENILKRLKSSLEL